MSAFRTFAQRLAPPFLCSLALAACTEAEPTVGRWETDGQVIALSGGDAGAKGACVTCHGLKGEGDGYAIPRLAGMERGYFLRQMEFFSQGMRSHPQMTWIADHMDWPARQKLAVYYEGLETPAPAALTELDASACRPAIAELYHRGDPERGIEPCAACHGDDGRGVGIGNPAIALQPAAYLAEQLRKWRSGERYGDPLDAMTHVSRLLAEEELAPLAGYSSALRDASAYPEPPAACPRTRRPDPRSGA